MSKAVKNEEEPEKTALSHSTAKNLTACEMKFVHYKVKKTRRDSDYKKSSALSVGSAAHWILEQSLGQTPKDILADIEHCFTDPDIQLPRSERFLVQALVLKMIRLNKKMNFRFVAVEPSVDLSWFTGKIDMIVEDKSGKWWIGDYKFVAGFSPERDGPSLFRDPQLNIYAARASTIADLLGLDIKNFGGCRYRVAVKPKLKQRATESDVAYTIRLLEAVKAYDVEVPVEGMNPEDADIRHRKLYRRSMLLRRDPSKATRNYNACMNFYKPCEYWSQCHGKLNSETSVKVTEEF